MHNKTQKMARKLTDKAKTNRILRRILNPPIDSSIKFIPPTIIKDTIPPILNNQIDSSKKTKLKIYKERNPCRILPFIRSGLKIYKLKKYDKFLLDTYISPKEAKELITIPKGLNIACKDNKIILVGAGAIGNWITIPKSDKVFYTMYSRTGHKTMAEYMVKNKIKTNYRHKKKIYLKKQIKNRNI